MIKEGSCGEDEIFEKLGNGLYITNNWYTRFQDYRNGDFSTVPRDGIFEIKNGKISKLVACIAAFATAPAFLKTVDAVSKEVELFPLSACGKGEPKQPMPSSLGGPYVRGKASVMKLE